MIGILSFQYPLLAQDNPFQIIHPIPTALDTEITQATDSKRNAVETESNIDQKQPLSTPITRETPLQETSKIGTHDDLGNLGLSLLEANYELLPNDENKLLLSTALDRIANDLCLKPLLYLHQSAADSKCTLAVSKLRKMDPLSPSLVCIDNGFASHACSQAYNQQTTVSYEEQDVIKSQSLDKEFGIITSGLGRRRERTSDITSSVLLKDACKAVLLASFNRPLPTPTIGITPPEMSHNDMGTHDGMNEVLSALSVTDTLSPTPQDEPKNFSRLRIISRSCMEAAQATLNNKKNNAEAKCFLNGFYSPTCIEALHTEEKARPTPSPQPGVTPGKNFAEF